MIELIQILRLEIKIQQLTRLKKQHISRLYLTVLEIQVIKEQMSID